MGMKKRLAFPYQRVAKLWANGRAIAEIGERIGYVDTGREDGDRFHSLGNHLRLMHRGCDRAGKIVRLPYRVSRAIVQARSTPVREEGSIRIERGFVDGTIGDPKSIASRGRVE